MRCVRYRSVAALAVALVIAGCSDADDASTAPSTTTTDAAASSIEVVDAQTAVELLAARDDLTVIDVRTPEEHAEGHLRGAELIDVQAGDFDRRIAALDPEAPYLVYCRTGNRSAAAAATMAARGFVEVYDAGGFAELADAGATTAAASL